MLASKAKKRLVYDRRGGVVLAFLYGLSVVMASKLSAIRRILARYGMFSP
ncbi:MAG: hypothetical protein GX425_15140 [Peptococcaceae bacterium]|nr:hypothetical protein [Pelotomaculum propionicicum]NLI13912.1 hypothetical protein [Peptococcaceae bacterium]